MKRGGNERKRSQRDLYFVFNLLEIGYVLTFFFSRYIYIYIYI